jgi:hypothetical protein
MSLLEKQISFLKLKKFLEEGGLLQDWPPSYSLSKRQITNESS